MVKQQAAVLDSNIISPSWRLSVQLWRQRMYRGWLRLTKWSTSLKKEIQANQTDGCSRNPVFTPETELGFISSSCHSCSIPMELKQLRSRIQYLIQIPEADKGSGWRWTVRRPAQSWTAKTKFCEILRVRFRTLHLAVVENLGRFKSLQVARFRGGMRDPRGSSGR